MSARQFSNKATPATLGGGISSSDVSLSLSTVAGLPASFPYTLVIEPDSVNAEVVSCTALAGTIATVTRGQDGTTAVAHNAGSAVYHDHSARDFQEPQDHIAASTNVHGLSGGSAVAGTTQTQTLTNKTVALGSNTVSGTKAQFNTAITDADMATLDGVETLTNKTFNLTSNTLSGTTAQFNTALSDNDFATLAGTETLTNKSLTAPTLTGTTTATDIKSNQTTGSSSRTVAPYAKIRRTTDQTVPTSSTTPIVFATLGEESDASFGDTGNGQLVCPVAGIYDFQFGVEVSDAGAWNYRLGILLGGAYIAMDKKQAGAGVFSAFQVTALGVRCAANDVITADIWQNSGASVTVKTTTNAAGTYLVGKWVMP